MPIYANHVKRATCVSYAFCHWPFNPVAGSLAAAPTARAMPSRNWKARAASRSFAATPRSACHSPPSTCAATAGRGVVASRLRPWASSYRRLISGVFWSGIWKCTFGYPFTQTRPAWINQLCTSCHLSPEPL